MPQGSYNVNVRGLLIEDSDEQIARIESELVEKFAAFVAELPGVIEANSAWTSRESRNFAPEKVDKDEGVE